MATVIDDVVAQALNTGLAKEAAGASDSRTRAWDNITMAVGTAQTNYVSAPSVIAAQGMRMLNGTPTMPPGNAVNANSAT